MLTLRPLQSPWATYFSKSLAPPAIPDWNFGTSLFSAHCQDHPNHFIGEDNFLVTQGKLLWKKKKKMTFLLSPRCCFQTVLVLPKLFYLRLAPFNIEHSDTATDLVSFAMEEKQVFKGCVVGSCTHNYWYLGLSR